MFAHARSPDAWAAPSMKRLSDRFAEAARSCPDCAQLARLMDDATRELGFHFFALLDHSSLGGSNRNLLRLDNYPEAWAQEMVLRNYGPVDPVHLASRRTTIAFDWSRLGELVRLQPLQRTILGRSRFFGLGTGLTVPGNMPGEPAASCSFAVRAGSDLPATRLRCAELIGAYALAAARRLRPWARRERPHLSPREVQCLRLVAMGKSDWEIARILGLSPHTARQYVKRARAAYDAVSRAQLVAYGLRDSWIGFDEAIPPFG